MRKAILYFTASWFLWSCNEGNQSIMVKNPGKFDVKNKEVELTISQLKPEGTGLPAFYDTKGQLIPVQFRDVNGDEMWDSAILQMSLAANDSMRLSIKWLDSASYPVFDKMTQVYFGYSEDRDNNYISLEQHVRPDGHEPQDPPYMYQFEGPGWENNLVGFRSYFDTRNGKDIFGKTTERMILQEVALGENYHELQPWGMDVLKVGSSLGAGSIAILKGDSLIRLGETGYSEFEKLEEGPVYSKMKMTYKDWEVLGEHYEIEETITIWANKRWYQSELTVKGTGSDTLVTGIVNLNQADVDSFSSNGYQVLYTHGVQSENKDALGMAVIVPSPGFAGVSSAAAYNSDVNDSELVLLQPSAGTYTFFFFAGWEEENSAFSSMDSFRSELQGTVDELSTELQVVVQ